jgi:hypothetical protein
MMCEKLDVIVDNESFLLSSQSIYQSIYQAYTYNQKNN